MTNKKAKKIKKIKKAKKIKRVLHKKKAKKVIRREKKFVIDRAQLDALLKKGAERGFITTSEILYAFPDIERNIAGFEEIYDDFREQGIQIKEVQEFLETKKQKEKKGKKALVGKIDPIQMYLKEIGKSSFLSAKEEKELAKKIEAGD
jgi:RNA polymerase primary sigma factor